MLEFGPQDTWLELLEASSIHQQKKTADVLLRVIGVVICLAVSFDRWTLHDTSYQKEKRRAIRSQKIDIDQPRALQKA